MKLTSPRFDQLQPRERLLAMGSAAVLLVMALDRFVLSPWMRHAHELRQEVRRMEQALQTHERLLARRDRVLADLARYHPYVKPPVADDLQMAALLTELQEIVTSSHVLLSEEGELKPLSIESTDLEKRYPLEMKFECGLEEWVELIFQLETSPSLYEIVRATLSVQSEAPDRLSGSLRLVGAAPAAPPRAAAQTGATHATAP